MKNAFGILKSLENLQFVPFAQDCFIFLESSVEKEMAL